MTNVQLDPVFHHDWIKEDQGYNHIKLLASLKSVKILYVLTMNLS
jgi:hypothetical protein